MTADASKPEPLEVAVLGAGFSGLGMAVALERAGYRSFAVFEKADEVGGTWRENRYPGCACDVPSHLYSFSFEPNPGWARMFSPQPEILAYLKHVADKHGARPYIRFRHKVERLTWDERESLWHVQTDRGLYRARVVVTGMGGLHLPAFPSIPGAESFAGPRFHSAEWRDDVVLEGKTVAVIGTGASAIQVVPAIASRVGRLLLFQRTPPWVLPKPDRAIGAAERHLYERLPMMQKLHRGWIWSVLESRAYGMLRNNRMMDVGERMADEHLRAQIPDEALRAKLRPTYRMGCKRVLISNDYYPALARENVEVVTDSITRMTPTGIVTADGNARMLDVIIYCTGFRPFEMPAEVIGRDGRSLNAEWKTRPQAYLGIAIAGYPNLFCLMGPNTGLGHNSMIYMIESQIAFVMDALATMKATGTKAMSPKPDVQTRFDSEVQERLTGSVWKSGCMSWYQNAQGHNASIWPGFTFEYRRRTKRVRWSDFERR